MTGQRHRRGAWVLGLAGCVCLGVIAAPAQAKKVTLAKTQTVNAQVPQGTAAATGDLESTITAGKKFKGRKIRDVNVTVQTTGSGPDSASDLVGQLSAPNGASTILFHSLGGSSIGPLTLDDESPFLLSPGSPPSGSLFLQPPYVGTARPGGLRITTSPLWPMDDGRVRGTWTLRLIDQSSGQPSVLNSWSLRVSTGKPYETK